MSTSKKPIIAYNWKGNRKAREILKEIAPLDTGKVEVVVAPLKDYLLLFKNSMKKDIQVSSQEIFIEENLSWADIVEANQLAKIGIKWVIVGHLERRSNMSDYSFFAKKIEKAQALGMKCIVSL